MAADEQTTGMTGDGNSEKNPVVSSQEGSVATAQSRCAPESVAAAASTLESVATAASMPESAAAAASTSEPAAATAGMPDVEREERVARRIKAAEAEVSDYVVERRRWYHAHPEVAYKEFETTEQICADLDALGIPYERPTETGVVATLRGEAPDAYDAAGNPRRRLMLRADIDALPVTEETGEPFSSQNEGFMHACGHDCHIAMLLGTAKLLCSIKDELAGEIRLVFQPAEEGGNGSKTMIEAGVLEGVDGVYGTHIWSDVEAGKVSLEAGPRMAATDWWRIEVTGRSAHGAMPNQGADAVLAGAAIVESLQAIVSRNMSPFEPAVVTVGQFHGGTARNVMAGSSWMEGTVRTFHEDAHELIPRLMERMASDVAAAYGCTAKLTYDVTHGTVVNEAAASERARRAACEVLGEAAITTYQGSMPGEDFSEYLRRRPGVFVFLGSGTADPSGKVWPQHSCHYDPNESVLVRGSELAAQYAMNFLGEA